MNVVPRPYRDVSDLQKMCAILQTGCAAHTDAYYIHPGELNLCLFNWLDGHNPWKHIYIWDDPIDSHNPWKHIYIWDDPIDSEHLLGWALLSTPWSSFDVFLQPELWKSAWADEVNTWVEEQSIDKAREQSHRQIWRMNIAETDKSLRAHVCNRGFQEVPNYAMLSLECNLDRELPQSLLPEGYMLRQVKEFDAVSRAAAQHAAFMVDKPFQEYLQQYKHFMDSPGYSRGHELIVVAPNQHVASFCMVWPDVVSRIGQVDPVGTHPDFQQKGLGKAVIRAGLQYLQSVGMRLVRICVRVDNEIAIKMYESVGFHTAIKLLTYQKLL